MIRAGLARVLKLFAALAGAAGAVGLVAGIAAGAGAARGVSLAWYAAGALLLLVGFVAASRGPTRAADDERAPLHGRSRRWASRAEQDESIGLSAVLVALGAALIVIGILIDPRHPLF